MESGLETLLSSLNFFASKLVVIPLPLPRRVSSKGEPVSKLAAIA